MFPLHMLIYFLLLHCILLTLIRVKYFCSIKEQFVSTEIIQYLVVFPAISPHVILRVLLFQSLVKFSEKGLERPLLVE
jgi:hypothetical protein